MKLIIELDVPCEHWGKLKEYYERWWNKYGILLDEEKECIYYEIEISFMPTKGQVVGTKFGDCCVIYSYLELDDRNEGYWNKSRIIVKEV